MHPGLSIEIALLAIVVIILIIYLVLNKEKIHIQPLIRFGRFNVLSMALVRTGWGLDLMERWAKKYGEWVRLFGLVSIGVGILGLFVNIASLVYIVVKLVSEPATQQVGLVVPFTNVPGLGYLAFSHWIIAIFILATVHEFAHGVVARVHNIPVRGSGFAVLKAFYIPLIPAAFVEPDEKQFPKRTDVEQYSVLTAGPVSNILLAIPFALLLLFVINPIETHMTEPSGFSFTGIVPNGPAALANVSAGFTYNYVNGHLTNDSSLFFKELWYNTKPGEAITLGAYDYATGSLNATTIQTNASPTDPAMAFAGITYPTYDEHVFKPQFKKFEKPFDWLRSLVKVICLFNLLVGLFNLMPLFITDGGQMVRVFTTRLYKDKKKAAKVHSLVCGISLIIILAALILPLFF